MTKIIALAIAVAMTAFGTPTKDVVENQYNDYMAAERAKMVQSPLNGEYVYPKDLNDRYIAVMIDNQYDARPQSGLSEFDIVYEILAEGYITRYLGIIGTSQPEHIGPVRSSRDYFIRRALEYDPYYVHVGGSTQAYAYLENQVVANIDGMKRGWPTFWRENHRIPPHNTYASYDGIIHAAEQFGYSNSSGYEGLNFYEEDTNIKGDDATSIRLEYIDTYVPSYKYNEEKKQYDRYINGEALLDETSEKQIYAKSIIVQFTKTNKIPNDPLLKIEVEMVGEGEGFYISNGKKQDITWKKQSDRSVTRFFAENGSELVLNPGKIWIQVFPDHWRDDITIK